jgi:hypothetical protein
VKSYRVHICPVGFEVDRVLKPLLDPRADKVWLVVKKSSAVNPDLANSYIRAIKEELAKEKIEYFETSCDINDLDDILRTLGDIFKKEKNNEIFINVSSGNKVMAIAGMMACMMWEGTPYYVIPERYNPITEPMTFGMKRLIVLPSYKIDKPPEVVLECISLLSKRSKHGVSKKTLIKHFEEKNLLNIQPVEGKDDITVQAKYRHLDEHILKPAKNWGYVIEEGQTRNKRIRLTDAGRNAIKVFCESE